MYNSEINVQKTEGNENYRCKEVNSLDKNVIKIRNNCRKYLVH